MALNITTITIKTKPTRERLIQVMLGRESYDSAINRLIDWYNETHPDHKKTEVTP